MRQQKAEEEGRLYSLLELLIHPLALKKEVKLDNERE